MIPGTITSIFLVVCVCGGRPKKQPGVWKSKSQAPCLGERLKTFSPMSKVFLVVLDSRTRIIRVKEYRVHLTLQPHLYIFKSPA